MGQKARIPISETVLKCMATGCNHCQLTARRCLPNRVLAQRSSNFSSVKHATSSPSDAIDEMGGIAREMVLDMVLRFWCRNYSGRIKSQVLHLATWQGNVRVPFCEHESCDRELGTLGFHGYFCEKRLRIYWRKWKMFRGLFLNVKILPNNISNFEIKG